MALSTDGLIEEIRRFRSDKMALVALIGSMGDESEVDALARLRNIIEIANGQILAIRKMPRAERRAIHATERIWHDVWELASEIEPWLAQVVARRAS